MSDLVDNERTKLMANWMNAMASGVIITGVVAPAVATIFGFSSSANVPVWLLVLSALIWLFSGFALHWLGTACSKEPQMTAFEIFALFGMPLVAVAIGYVAVLLNERSVRRHRIHLGE